MTNFGMMVSSLKQNIARAVVGKDDVVELMLTALLCEGHVLIEDVPGVGKTTLASALARSLSCSFKRIQFTPDITPSDITGFTMPSLSGEMQYHPGAIMSQIVLADEINRTSPKTQSALLEVMEERQVTVDGVTYPLARPFMVLATQNPVDFVGTYPLPEAQMDRFCMRVSLGYPSLQDEMDILDRYCGEQKPMESVVPVCSSEDVIAMQQAVKTVYCSKEVRAYIASICAATRNTPLLSLGASTRAAIALIHAAQANALLCGRDYIIPEDVQHLAPSVLCHRLPVCGSAHARLHERAGLRGNSFRRAHSGEAQMTARGFYLLLFGSLMLFTALSVGSSGAFLLGAAALFCWALSLLCVCLAAFSCRVEQSVEGGQAARGGACRFHLRVFGLPAVIAPIALKIELPGGRQSDFWLSTRLFGTTESENEFACPHVGVFPVGVSQLTISDCFGLFAFRRSMRGAPQNVAVLPNPVQTAPLPVSPGEGENSSAQRALSDHSIPEDIRAWQDGDELKRVHWKLSARRQSLMVHTYETPQRPDALILLDIAQPSGAARSALIDALTEGCAGTIESLLQAGRMTRLPLELSGQGELAGQGMESFDAMRRALAAAGYNRQDDFARVLLLASPRMRRTGSVAVFSTRLTPAIADAALALSRMGARMRYTLVTAGETTEEQAKLLNLLRVSGVETLHVKAG
ncbi:MAG: AAA family ATPase [Christensenellales bacterium]